MIRMGKPMANKLLDSSEKTIEVTRLKDGLTISFHHHLRNSDYILKLVLEKIIAKGLKNITIASRSLSDCHDFLVDAIEDGTVSALETSGLRSKLSKYLTINL